MTSLYGNLFKYRHRENRAPLEDFLTEAMRDLLARAPQKVSYSFIELLLRPEEVSTWRKIARESPCLTWRTQVPVPEGRIDLLVELGHQHQPLLAVELKVAAPFQIGSKTSKSEGTGQLAVYGKWLARSCAADTATWPGALAIVTHSTKAPTDFLAKSGDKKYGVSCRAICSWSRIWRWLRLIRESNTSADGFEGSDWKALALELANFLEEQRMSSETIDHSDISAADLYIGTADRFTNTFKAIYAELASPECLGSLIDRKKSGHLRYNAEGRVLHDHVYFKSGRGVQSDWYLDWGIRLNGTSGWWDGALPEVPKSAFAFMYLGSERTDLPSRKLTGDWRLIADRDQPDERYPITTREMSKLTQGKQQVMLGDELVKWMLDSAAQIKGVVTGRTGKKPR